MKLQDYLNAYRTKRNFNVAEYVQQKIEAVNKFFQENQLDAAVLGISGGIDSAVVLYLLDRASKEADSALKKIWPISIPIFGVEGVTGQYDAYSKSNMVMQKCGYKTTVVNLKSAYKEIVNNSHFIDDDKHAAWAEGQMASVLRTPVLYYHAAILQTQGYKSLVVGTTNRDEGSYIGFFGKASDAMVDLQIIGDLHKSEVYQVAKYLGVPEQIISAVPKGDVWDNKVDTDMIGATYDFLEMYLGMLPMDEYDGFAIYTTLESEEEQSLFIKSINNIEDLHKKNKHKYQVGNPAHFIDIMERKISGGW